MLVLSRKLNEEIKIDDNIVVKILDIENGQVKLGIIAPNYIKVYRKEIYDKISEENKKATKPVSKGKIKSLASTLKKK